MAAAAGSARDALERGRALQAAGQAEQALAAAKEALEKFRTSGDQAGLAEALRYVVGGQIELLEQSADKVQTTVKEEAAMIKKSLPDGKVADALMHLAAAEVHLFRVESDKALKAATEAANALAKEGEHRHESVALQMVVNAHLMRSNGPKALAAANASLSAAQKAGDRSTEGSAWLAVATARHVSGGEDAKEAAGRAAAVFRELGDRANEAAALLLSSRVAHAQGDLQAAAGSARDALAIALEMRNGPQAAAASEALVEAQLADETASRQAVLQEAERTLTSVQEIAAGSHFKGVAQAMSALVLAHTGCKGVDSALELVKRYIVELRERGDQRGEVRMLHKLATMSPVPAEALNSAQVAVALAQKIGDCAQEAAVKNTLTDIYVAKGKVEKAPTRKTAMRALSDLAKALESQDADRFQDAAKYLDGFYNALRQDDIQAAMGSVIAKDPVTYMTFLQAHGGAVSDEKPRAPTAGCTIRGVTHEILYFGFTSGGISYGPRYRINMQPYKRYNSETQTVSIVRLNDASDQWERELMYSPSLLDGTLQHTAAGGYEL